MSKKSRTPRKAPRRQINRALEHRNNTLLSLALRAMAQVHRDRLCSALELRVAPVEETTPEPVAHR